MHALILGARAPACLEWARAFRASGWQVSVADSLGWPLTRWSRAVDRCLRLPEPRRDPAAWIDALRAAVLRHGIDLVLPTCEEVFYLAHGRARLPAGCAVFTSDAPLLHRLHHKGRFAELTAGWSLAAPPTTLLESPAAALALADRADTLVFKPAYSRFASRTLIRPPPSRLRALRPTPQQPWVAQRFVAGREHCSFSLLAGGRLRAHAGYRPRHRIGRGSGLWFEPADPAPVQAFVEHFGEATGYTGQVGFDFIEDATGRFHVLECNPRATSGVHLFDTQPQALVRALVDGLAGAGQAVPAPVLHAGAAPRMVAFAMLLFAGPQQVLRAPGGLGGWARDWARAADVIATPGDRGPLWAQGPALAEIVGRALWRRCSLLAATTADIEWDGEPLDAPAGSAARPGAGSA